MFRWLYRLFVPADLTFTVPPPTPLSMPPETRVRVNGQVGTLTGFQACDDSKTRARVVFTDPQRKSWLAQVSLHCISLIPG